MPPESRQRTTTTTIVIPAFNEALRVGRSLETLRRRFETDVDVDLVIVDDGSTDGTGAAVMAAVAGWKRVRMVRLPWNQGKGGATKVGVSMARGDVIVVMDADLSGDLDDFGALTDGLRRSDIVIGSRMVAGSRVVYGSRHRRVLSRVFNVITCTATGVIASDTQCGYKAFRAPVAKLLFHLTETQGFAFDIELLVLAQTLGFSVTEQHIGWREVEGSRVHLLRDTSRMLRDIARSRRFAARMRKQFGTEELTRFGHQHQIPRQATRDSVGHGALVVDLRSIDTGDARIA